MKRKQKSEKVLYEQKTYHEVKIASLEREMSSTKNKAKKAEMRRTISRSKEKLKMINNQLRRY